MILLEDVGKKLQEILNKPECPGGFTFVVKTAGFHIDKVSNDKKGINLIPVFISQVGGEYNPVPNLKEVNYTYEVNIYFPVRFKEDFYNINPYLAETFVGKKIMFGDDNALCNVSVPETGEIIEFEAIREFESWIQTEYGSAFHLFQKDQQVNEFYIAMKFRLFATSIGEGFIFGNDVKYKLSFKLGETTYTENLVWDSSGTGASVSPVSEQLVGVDKFVRNIGNITNFNKSISAYVRNNEFWSTFLQYYNEQRLNELGDIKLTKTYTFGETTKEYEFNQITLSYNENVALGEPVSFTLAFGDGE